ncbi:hypothetical protein [Cupriavidus sp. CuC1]|uniref:hypothetical protein n=1 Tax=Cupriavidus sp. CuC1 TaxID=3373131 RepID=UPI0037D21653
MPLFYPTLWVTVHLRGNALAVNTIHNALNAIKCIEAWQAHDAIDDSPEVPQSRLTQVHRQAASTGIPSIAADIRDTRFLDWIAIPASGLA